MLPRSTEIRRVVSLFVYSNKYVYMLLGWNQINVYIVYIIYKVNSLLLSYLGFLASAQPKMFHILSVYQICFLTINFFFSFCKLHFQIFNFMKLQILRIKLPTFLTSKFHSFVCKMNGFDLIYFLYDSHTVLQKEISQ